MNNIFSVKEYSDTHWIVHLFGLKIKFAKWEYYLKSKKNPYLIYKKKKSDITKLPPAQGQIRDIQLANLEILKEFDYVSKLLGLEYWLDFGTLLGAVRHKGYIPWDDDIDISMMRDDYDKLIESFENVTRNKDLYVDIYFDRKNNVIAKIRHRKCEYIFIDVTPVDICPVYDNSTQLKLTKIIRKLDRTCLVKTNSYDELRKMIICMRDKYVKSQDKNDNGIVMGIEYSQPYKNCFFDKSKIYPLQTLEFENYNFPVFNNYDEYLKLLYGNYMEYPKKFGMGHTMYLNLSNEDKQVIKELIGQK